MSSKVKHPISPLQARMIEDMTARKLKPKTQTGHLRSCRRFAAYLGRSPKTAIPEDVRQFQLALIENGVRIGTRNMIMTGVKFLVRVTLRRLDLANEIYHLPEPQKVPVVLSPTEVERLLKMSKTPPGLSDHLPAARPIRSVASILSCVFVSKSPASWRSRSCSCSSPRRRLTMRPRLTGSRAWISSAQRSTLV